MTSNQHGRGLDNSLDIIGRSACLSDDRIYNAYKIEALLRFLCNQGLSPADVLADTGLSTEMLSLPDTRTSLRQLATVFRNAQNLCDDAATALRAGQDIHVSNYGLYGYALLSSSSLRRTLEFSIRYHRLATPTVVMQLTDDGEHATFSMADTLNVQGLEQFNIEFQLSLVHSLFRDVLGDDFRPSAILVAHKPPGHHLEYESILDCEVRFEQPLNALQFPERLLDSPLPKGNTITEVMVNELCDRLLKEQEERTGLTRRIYKLLVENPGNIPSPAKVASQFGMTARTLRRKLQSRGTHYQAIVDDVRKSLAIHFLRNSQLSIEDIAEQVGYSDAANFRTAFKRWTGKTPAQYRP